MKKKPLLLFAALVFALFAFQSHGQLKKLKSDLAKVSKSLDKETPSAKPSSAKTTEVGENSATMTIAPALVQKQKAFAEQSFVVGPSFSSLRHTTFKGQPILINNIHRSHSENHYQIMDIQRNFRLGVYDRNGLLTSREIASQDQWRNSFLDRGASDSEDDRRMLKGYHKDLLIRAHFSTYLTKPEPFNQYFSQNTTVSSGNSYNRVSNRSVPEWGGVKDPFKIKEAYEKFLVSNLLEEFNQGIQKFPSEGIIIIPATVSTYDFLTESFKITLELKGFTIKGIDGEYLQYEYKVPEAEAAKIVLPKLLFGVLKGKVDTNDNWAKSQFEQSNSLPKGEYKVQGMETVVNFYKDYDFFEEKVLTIDLSTCTITR